MVVSFSRCEAYERSSSHGCAVVDRELTDYLVQLSESALDRSSCFAHTSDWNDGLDLWSSASTPNRTEPQRRHLDFHPELGLYLPRYEKANSAPTTLKTIESQSKSKATRLTPDRIRLLCRKEKDFLHREPIDREEPEERLNDSLQDHLTSLLTRGASTLDESGYAVHGNGTDDKGRLQSKGLRENWNKHDRPTMGRKQEQMKSHSSHQHSSSPSQCQMISLETISPQRRLTDDNQSSSSSTTRAKRPSTQPGITLSIAASKYRIRLFLASDSTTTVEFICPAKHLRAQNSRAS